jgi:hypothetical protein
MSRLVTIPKSMLPYHIWGARCLNEVVKCPGCGEPAVVGDAVAYQAHLFAKEGVLYGGYYVFHNFVCLLNAVSRRDIGET